MKVLCLPLQLTLKINVSLPHVLQQTVRCRDGEVPRHCRPYLFEQRLAVETTGLQETRLTEHCVLASTTELAD